jgi:hypothetical protein
MKKYVYLIAMVVLAIQFLSCSKSDDEKVLQQQSPVMSRSLSDDTEIPTGAIGGPDTKPVEGQMFYEEISSDVTSVVALGSFYVIDQNDSVQHYDNLGGAVQIKDGGSLTMTIKGKGLHIEGSGVTHPQSGFINHTKISLDIDDAELLKSCKATITNIDLTTVSDVTMYGESFTISTHLSASDIPMESDAVIYTHWKGGTVTYYSYITDDLSMSLYDNPTNTMEVWISFKDGSSAKARIGR